MAGGLELGVIDVVVAGGVELGVAKVVALVAGGVELGVVKVVIQAGRIKTTKNASIMIVILIFIKCSSP